MPRLCEARSHRRGESSARFDPQTPHVFAFDNHRYRLVLCEKGPRQLRMHGLATLSEVWLDNTNCSIAIRCSSWTQAAKADSTGLINWPDQLALRFVHRQHEQTARPVCNDASTTLQWRDTQTLANTLRVPDAPRWRSHTCGEPTLHRVALKFTHNEQIELERIGFGQQDVDRGPLGDGFRPAINGVPVVARGACRAQQQAR